MRIGRFILIAAVLAFAADAQGVNPAPANAAGADSKTTGAQAAAREASFVKITIDSSRSPITMGTEAGVSAEVKNVSPVLAVRLYENEAVFTTMPETRVYGPPQEAIQGCATFPTQGNVRPTKRPARGYDLLIQPGDSYRIFWDMTRNGCTGERLGKHTLWSEPVAWMEEKWQRMMFPPGTYRVYLNLVLYPEKVQAVTPTPPGAPGPNAAAPAGYHTATEGRDVQVSASQQIILLGAFLGGLLAYLIKEYYGVNNALIVGMTNTLGKRIISQTEWLAAGLFAAATVILASRLSDTFPVKVNANDFWGAIALGFVFQWIGVKLLEKLPGMGGAPAPAPPAPAPPVPTPQAAPPAAAQPATANP